MAQSNYIKEKDGKYHHYVEIDGKTWRDGIRTGYNVFKKPLTPKQSKALYRKW